MRTAAVGKLAIIACLGVASSMITLSILRRSTHAQAVTKADAPGREPEAAVEVEIDRGIPVRVDGEPIQVPPVANDPSIASYTMKSLEVQAVKNKVHIVASAHIRDTRPNMRFVWSVRALSPAKQGAVVFEKLYDNQVFALPENQELSPTFEDILVLPLPKGTYLIEVSVFLVTPGKGLAGVRNPELKEDLRGPSGHAKVVLGR